MREVTAEQLSFEEPRKGLGLFEKYLSVWVILCIVAGIFLGEVAPGFTKYLATWPFMSAKHRLSPFPLRFASSGVERLPFEKTNRSSPLSTSN